MNSIYLAENIKELILEQKSKTAAYILNYHIVFRTKKNRSFFDSSKTPYILKTLLKIAEDKGYVVFAVAVVENHIHLVIGLTPVDRISDVLQILKGSSSKFIRERYPELKELSKSLWADGYYVESVGLKNIKQVIHYVSRQDEHHKNTAG